jgi:hypothetical protein
MKKARRTMNLIGRRDAHLSHHAVRRLIDDFPEHNRHHVMNEQPILWVKAILLLEGPPTRYRVRLHPATKSSLKSPHHCPKLCMNDMTLVQIILNNGVSSVQAALMLANSHLVLRRVLEPDSTIRFESFYRDDFPCARGIWHPVIIVLRLTVLNVVE